MRAETRHSIVLVAGSGSSLLLGMMYQVYASRALGPAEYGDFIAAISFFSMALFFAAPVNGVVTRFSTLYAGEGAWGKARSLSREVMRRVLLFTVIGAAAGAAALKPLMAWREAYGDFRPRDPPLRLLPGHRRVLRGRVPAD